MIEGMDKLVRRLDAVAKSGREIPRVWAPMAVGLAKRRVARKTSYTGRTIRVVRVTDQEATIAVGGAGPYLEGGTRPHIIRPRRAKMLRFPAAGTPVTLAGRVRTGAARRLGTKAYAFARFVRHPGTRAQPFFFGSAREALSTVGVGQIIERWNRAA